MRRLASDAMIDDSGQLYILGPGMPDPFDPPGYAPPRVWEATGYTFEDVPIYGWPLGVIYQNNPLQWATTATAEKIVAECLKRFSGFSWSISAEEVKVGPFRWQLIRKIVALDNDGPIVSMNAGEMASQLARYPDGWQAQIARTIRDGKAARDREDS